MWANPLAAPPPSAKPMRGCGSGFVMAGLEIGAVSGGGAVVAQLVSATMANNGNKRRAVPEIVGNKDMAKV
jgi:hypothetical protein